MPIPLLARAGPSTPRIARYLHTTPRIAKPRQPFSAPTSERQLDQRPEMGERERWDRRRNMPAGVRPHDAERKNATAVLRNARQASRAETEEQRADERGVKPRWNPKKRLSYAAMAGLKEMHTQDPETWSAERLATTFGVSYEAVKRVLRSNHRREERGMPKPASAVIKPDLPTPSKWSLPGATGPAAGPSTAKWDKNNSTGPIGNRFALTSPAERVQRAYALKRQAEEEAGLVAEPKPQGRQKYKFERQTFERPEREEREDSDERKPKSFGLRKD